MNKRSIEIMSTKISEESDIYEKLFKDQQRKEENMTKLSEN